jgi:predicted O-methyltransferase YrrM
MEEIGDCNMRLSTRYEILKRAVSLANDGLILEFGVATGSTIYYLARLLHPRRIYGFDSFTGLPEVWGHYEVGHFACDIPKVPDNVELVVGMFADTIPLFLEKYSDNIALLHIDCDLYSSTCTVLNLLASRIVKGTVIVLDEFWIVEEHERRAFDEFMTEHNRTCNLDSRTAEQACMVMQ